MTTVVVMMTTMVMSRWWWWWRRWWCHGDGDDDDDGYVMVMVMMTTTTMMNISIWNLMAPKQSIIIRVSHPYPSIILQSVVINDGNRWMDGWMHAFMHRWMDESMDKRNNLMECTAWRRPCPVTSPGSKTRGAIEMARQKRTPTFVSRYGLGRPSPARTAPAHQAQHQ